MNDAESRFLKVLKTEFHSNTDDTLINRLVKSIICQDNYHSSFWSNLSSVFWHSIVDSIDIHDKSISELKLFIKITVSLSARYNLQFGKFNPTFLELVKECLQRDLILLGTIIHTFSTILRNINRFETLISLPWIYDEEILGHVFNHLDVQNSIYQFEDNLSIISHYLFVKVQQQDVSTLPIHCLRECLQLTDIGLKILLAYSFVCNKFTGYLKPITISPNIVVTVETFKDFSIESQINLAYLLCSCIITSSSSAESWISLFSTVDHLPRLCSSLIHLYLKANKRQSGVLWQFIISKWCDYLHTNVKLGDREMVQLMINPIIQSNPKDHILDISENVLLTIVNEVVHNVPNSSDLGTHTYYLHLWSFLKYIVKNAGQNDFIIIHLSKVFGYLNKIYIRSPSTKGSRELNSVLDFIVTCLIELEQSNNDTSQFILMFLNNLINYCSHFTMFVSSVLAFMRFLNCLTLVSKNHNEIILVWPYLFKLISRISCSKNDEEQEMYGDIIVEIACDILNYMAKDSFISLWTPETRQSFVQFTNYILQPENISKFMFHVRFRALIISVFIIMLISINRQPYADFDDQFRHWIKNTLDYLVDFDFTELTESKSVSRLVWTNIQLLFNEQSHDSHNYLIEFHSLLMSKWIAYFGKDYSISITNEMREMYCPTCTESVEELIEEIILDGNNNILVDCTEG